VVQEGHLGLLLGVGARILLSIRYVTVNVAGQLTILTVQLEVGISVCGSGCKIGGVPHFSVGFGWDDQRMQRKNG
jgi:hypothetical protein